MVGLVLVSHSRPLALAVQELVRSMTGAALPLALAAGAGERHDHLGTDAVEIAEAIRSVQGPEGVLVLMDMGSAIISSETALDLMEPADRKNVRFCSAPFVEGAVAAGVTANLGSSLEDVYAEALAALKQKEQALQIDPSAGSSETAATAVTPEAVAPQSVARLTIANPHGLHARPAARLIGVLKPFRAEMTIRNCTNKRGPVPVRSLSRLASLEILKGHEIEIAALGADAASAVEKVVELARTNFGEADAAKVPTVALPKTCPAPADAPLPISEGLAIAPALFFRPTVLDLPTNKISDVPAEFERLQKAIVEVQESLEQRRGEIAAWVGASDAGIFEAQIVALQDPELIESARRLISDEHKNAALAWSEAGAQVVRHYDALQDGYLRERAADIEDVTRQVLDKLAARQAAAPVLHDLSILIAEDFTPGQISGLPKDLVAGVILLGGGPTAHSSILLRALGIPALVQARSAFSKEGLEQPGLVAFDGSTGEIWRNPAPDVLKDLRHRQVMLRQRVSQEKEASLMPGATLDGHRVEIFANIGQAAEVAGAVQNGAEGVGLLRTEFLFLDRETAPTECEQIKALEKIAGELDDRPLVVRTLDIGGDKPAPYLRMAEEANPFLGVRALRLCFAREELFVTHLRAILRAASGRDVRIMFPMVADVADFERARGFLAKAHEELERENIPHPWPISTGLMIEIPSAAVQAEALAEQADFFSIGTNDLTQYTLAADRGNPALAAYQDAAHPAILRLIELVVRGAQKHERPVAVCGEAGSDPLTSLLLIGLGVDELSVTPAKIAHLKATLRGHKLGALQQLAQRALECGSSAEVRRLSLS